MNYRHDFHAGNFADVFKHIILTRVLLHLIKKPAAFRFIDTHAGSGFYDLFGMEAGKTSEWQAGIGRLLTPADPLPVPAADLLEPYLQLAEPAIRGAEGISRFYPGSPAIASALLRPQDKMIYCELHPLAAQELRNQLGWDRRGKIIKIDGFAGLNAFVPPVERRGLALIDPPYEDRDDFERGLKVLESAWRKWSTGIFILWYPVKDRTSTQAALRRFADGKIKRVLRLELQIAEPVPAGPLTGNGMLIVNPPFPLQGEAEIILPFLASSLAQDAAAACKIEWLAGE